MEHKVAVGAGLDDTGSGGRGTGDGTLEDPRATSRGTSASRVPRPPSPSLSPSPVPRPASPTPSLASHILRAYPLPIAALLFLLIGAALLLWPATRAASEPVWLAGLVLTGSPIVWRTV